MKRSGGSIEFIEQEGSETGMFQAANASNDHVRGMTSTSSHILFNEVFYTLWDIYM